MSKILKLKDPIYRYKYILLLLLISVPFTELFNISGIFLFLNFLNFLNDLYNDSSRKANLAKTISNNFVILFISLFFLTLISILINYSSGDIIKSSLITRNLSILLLPIIVFYNKLKGNVMDQILILKSLIISVVLIGFLFYSISLYEQYEIEGSIFPLFAKYFYRSRSTKIFYEFFHPTYVALFITASILLIISNFNHLLKKSIYILYIVFVVLLLIFLKSKIVLFIILPFLVISFLANTIKKFIILLLISGFLVIINSERIYKYAISYSFENVKSDTTPNKWNSISLRIINWNNSYQIFKKNLFTGVGKQNVKSERKTQYLLNNIVDFPKEYLTFNSHNQFLEYSISFGIIGLLWFLIILTYPLFTFNVSRSYIIFILMVALFCFTESILERQQGVLFYSIMNAVLFFSTNKNEN